MPGRVFEGLSSFKKFGLESAFGEIEEASIGRLADVALFCSELSF